MEANLPLDLNALKLDLIKQVSSIQDPHLLQQMQSLLDSQGKGSHDLSEEQLRGLDIAIDQLDRGEGVPYSEVRQRLNAKQKLQENNKIVDQNPATMLG